MKTTLPFLLSALLLTATARSQTLKVSTLTATGNQLTITVQDTGSTTGAYQLQSSPAMAAGTWSGLGATFAAVPGQAGFFRATFTRPTGSRYFFRVLRTNGTADDTDGDGLSNVFESGFGTNPNLSDSDSDGFDDGTEFAYGTNAISSSSFPSQASLPAVEFASSLSAATEGGPVHTITITSVPPFTGTIRYSVNPRSTAVAPADFQPLSGSVGMVNGVANLSVTLTDDLTIKGDRLLLLDLDKNPAGNAYRPAGAGTHILRLTDNDRYWSGALQSDLGGRNLRLRVLKNAGGAQIAFVSGASDGLPRTEVAGTSSQSTGIIPVRNLAGQPQEIWPASNVTYTEGSIFSAGVQGLPVVETAIVDSEPLQRVLQLTAQSSNPSHRVTNSVIIGQYTEQITHATNPAITYLNRTATGGFVLRPDVPADPVLNSAFAPQ